MNQEIHTHLEKLKIELGKLEPAVKHLQQADENATTLIASLTNMHKEYEKHLEGIEKSLADANDKHQKQLTKEIQESTVKLNDLGSSITTSFKSIEKEVKDLLDEYEFLSSETEKLVNKIDKVDFPTRLDKIDSTVSSINQGLQNTQSRIGDLERNLKDDISAKYRELISKVETFESTLKQKFDTAEKNTNAQFDIITKENRLLKILIWVGIGLSVVVIMIQFIRIPKLVG